MGGKKAGGENTRKVAGNAKKAEAAAQKEAAANAKVVAAEDRDWDKGAKSNAKKQTEAEKKTEAARKKAERDALLAEEEKSQRTTPKGGNAKSAAKKSKSPAGTLDLSQLDDDNNDPSSPATATAGAGGKKATTLNASGIDNALDALSLTTQNPSATQKTDRRPTRRIKAAFAAYQERRRDSVAKEYPGLRKTQRDDILWKEFEKSEENPLNQAGVVEFDASQEEVRQVMKKARDDIEGRLGE